MMSSKSAATQVHDWVVDRLGGILGSVGHRVKIHNITPTTDKERGDVEIRDYVVLEKPRDLTDCLPPPRTLILDFTLTLYAFWKITDVFSGTADAHQADGWCPRS